MTTEEVARTPRVISLLPAGTEIVAALGAVDLLVGISHECDYPHRVASIARVTASHVDPQASSSDIDNAVRTLSAAGGAVFALHAHELARLAPTVIITQSLCEVCAVSEGDVRTVASVLNPAPVIVPLSGKTLSGVWNDIHTVAGAIGCEHQAALLVASVHARLEEVHRVLKAARAPRLRVAVIEWLDPLFVAGHWMPEVIRRAGGIDVLAEPGSHSVNMDVEAIRHAAPELLLFAPCGFDVERSAREAKALLGTSDWAWAGGLQSWALDGNALTSRPGPRLADAVEVIAAIVAPTLFAPPQLEYARQL